MTSIALGAECPVVDVVSLVTAMTAAGKLNLLNVLLGVARVAVEAGMRAGQWEARLGIVVKLP